MTSQRQYGDRGKKPIRRDRLLIAGLIVVAAIVVPLLLKGGCTKREQKPLAVSTSDKTGGTTSTTPATTTATTPTTPTDVDSIVKEITSGSGSTPSASSTSAPSTPKPPATSTTTTPAASSSSSPGTGILSHTVKQGETLQAIANAMGVSLKELRADNQLYGTDAPKAGRILYAAKKGLVHTIKSGQTLTDIAATYGVTVSAIASANGIAVSATIFSGSRLVIPGAGTSLWDTVTTLSHGKPSRFIWPLTGEVVSGFGWRLHPVLNQRMEHTGIDLDVLEGTAVHASAGGEVYFYGEQPGYGNVLILQHTGGFYTMYGHLKSSMVKLGQYVEQGQQVALSGNTGISSGPHLHFELRNGEIPLDPLGGPTPFLP